MFRKFFYISNIFLLSFSLLLSEVETEQVYKMSDFVVTESEDKGYYSANTASVTNANELVKNTPINVSVINEELLKDLGIQTTEDLAQVSASLDTDPTSYSLDQISIRGFRNTFTRYNGFRRNLARDGYNISRYDIIKGANSLIYGEASPGGSINAIPLIANFRKDGGSISFGLGNKNFDKKVFNYNQIISDKLALRYMMVDHYRGYEHSYKNYSIKSQTLSANYRPDTKTSVLLHFENVNSKFSFPTLALRDNTFVDDANIIEDDGTIRNMLSLFPTRYEGILSVSAHSDQRRDYHVMHEGSWVKAAPQSLIDSLISATASNTAPLNNDPQGSSGIKITNRQDLIDYYSDVNESNYGYQSGPDKNKAVEGHFATLEYQRILHDNLEFSLSLNSQKNNGKNLSRDSNGIGRLIDSYTIINDGTDNQTPYPRQHVHVFANVDTENNLDFSGTTYSPSKYFKTYWTKNIGESDRGGAKSTLLWEKSFFLDKVGKIENKFLFGLNFHLVDKKEKGYDQVPEDATDLNNDGSYLAPKSNDVYTRASWVRNNLITDAERAYEYISLNKGFNANRSIMRFNEIIESDFSYNFSASPLGTFPTGYTRTSYNDGNRESQYQLNDSLFGSDGKRSEKAKWAQSTDVSAKIKTSSQWIGAQSSIFKGRLRTLLGLKFDTIKIDSSFRKVSIFGINGTDIKATTNGVEESIDQSIINNEVSEKFTKLSPSIGALYWFNEDVGLFANYAESLQSPRGNNEDRTPIGTLAEPEIGKGSEIGIRFSQQENNLDGQLTFYSIKKQNDNEFKYSDRQLKEIYPLTSLTPNQSWIYNENGALVSTLLPGRRANGDETLSQGIELDINYNPTKEITFIASINHTLKNEIEKIHPRVVAAGLFKAEDKKLYGRPDYRASLTGKYTFYSGKMKGFSLGISQHFRSGTNQTRYAKYSYQYDGNGDVIDSETTVDYFYPTFEDEHNTIAFLSYQGRLIKGQKNLKYSINLRVNNLFDNRQFINRNNYGFYRESRSYNISTKINF